MPARYPTEKALIRPCAVLALVLLLGVSPLQAEPVAANQPAPWDHRPNDEKGAKTALPPVWRGEAAPSGTEAAHADLPGDWATPAVQNSEKAVVKVPEKAPPDTVAEPKAVSTGANPPPQLDQAMLEGVRVRLRNLGLLGLTDVSDSALAEAVRQFQVSINIPETGVLDRDTLGRLLVP